MSFATPLPDDSPTRPLQRLGTRAPGVRGPGRATLFQRPTPGCGRITAAVLGPVPGGLPVGGLHARAATGDLPCPLAVVVADGRRIYAGPRVIAQGCGDPLPATGRIPRRLDRTQPPPVLTSTCARLKESPA